MDSPAIAGARASALGTAAAAVGKVIAERADLRIRELPFLSVASLRVSPKAAAAPILAQVLGALALETPARACTMTGSESALCGWIEPRAWLLVSTQALAMPVLEGALMTDVSDRLASFELSGAQAREVVAAGCDPGLFGIGSFTRVRFASFANAIVGRLGPDLYRVMVDVSIAATFAEWLADAARNAG
jgi:heterotetrameric sarcosine oxidase gamma subunit